MFGILEKIGRTASQIFGKTPMATRLARPSEGRVLEDGNWSIRGRNIPAPWQKREWSRDRDTANLPAVASDITGTSGPRRSMFPQIINPQLFQTPGRSRPFRGESEYQSQKTLHESEVIAMDPRSRGIASSNPRQQYHSRDERLARGIGSDNHTAALDSVKKHRGRGTDVLSDSPYPRDEALPPGRIGSVMDVGERVSLLEVARRLVTKRIRSVNKNA